MDKKPTIKELEDILSSEPDMPVDVLPNGEVKVFVVSPAFKKELQELINRHSIENGSDTPDFILADYMVRNLEAFNAAVTKRANWYK